ncbi:DUF4393 domain-containing protein [Paenibacillus sp. FSL K6-4396]|uniref:DUF4393 domain-containing protein n=1 Tax=Paenibacillus sp. FSL K6-4396 TaxID=2921506 RepID=UPI0030F87007
MAEPNLFSEVANSASDIVKNLPEDVKNDLVRGPAQEIGSGISNLVYVVFSPLLMSRVRIEHKVKKMKEELTKSINSIPSEKLVEPSLNIVGPALEGSKYYIENDSIRGLFVRLIASAANLDKRDEVHPSYVEIIKQLSPFDAKCLEFLVQETTSISCGTIIVNSTGGSGYQEVKYFFPFPGINKGNMEKYMSSVDNLIRLGILVCIENKFTDEKRYETLNTIVGKIAEDIEQDVKEKNPAATAVLVGKAWSFTQLGEHFINSCVIDKSIVDIG